MKHVSLILGMVCLWVTGAFAQMSITGTITDEAGEPLIGANVLVKGTTKGAVSDFDGNYAIGAYKGDVLVFSYTGFATQEVTVGDDNIVNVVMSEGVTLSTAVVTALGITKEEKAIGYAVQEVGGDEIVGANETNFVQSLAGKVAGVQVTSSTGTAGASSFILIRGANTIAGNNQPLIVIDGIPIDNSQLRSGDAVASVANSNRAIDINQEEIETVTVLKGAAATALYGSQAGNGAIVITTKKGKRSKQAVTVDFSSTLTFSEINKVPELQTTYAQGLGGAYAGPESGSGYSYGPLIDTMRYANNAGVYAWDPNGSLVGQSHPDATNRPANRYDHYDFFQRGIATRNNLAISAANDNTSVRFSMGYLYEQGVIPRNDFAKMNLGLNVTSRLSDKVNVTMGVQYINSGGTRIEQGSNVSGVMLGLLRTAATFDNAGGFDDPVNTEAAYVLPNGVQRNYRGGGAYDNPYWTVNRNPLEDDVNRFIGTFSLSYDAFDWLNISYRPGIDYYSDFRDQFFAIGSRTFPQGKVFKDQNFSYNFYADLLATLKKDFTEDFNGSLTLGHNMRDVRLDNLYSEANALVIPGFYDLSNGSQLVSTTFSQQRRTQALFANADLGYKGMLYLTLTGRSEEDSSLPEENNRYFFYSVSGSFVFSELMPNNEILSFGKLRASYGDVGLSSPYLYATDNYYTGAEITDGWVSPSNVQYPLGNGIAGFQYGNVLGNPNLRPERQSTFEVGVDLRFLENRIGLDLTYYSIRSRDIILSVPIAPSTGFSNIIQNAASMTNNGIEAVLRTTPVSRNGFEWNLDFNYTQNRNEVTELAEGVENVFLGGFTGASTYAVVGQPYSTIYGFGFYKDANGNRVIGADGFPLLDPTERAFESALPDFTLGIRNTFTYKGVTLSALLDIKQGGVMWNGTRSALYFFGTHQETADLRYTTQVFDGALAQYDSEGNLMFDANGNVMTSGANDIAVYVDENWLAFGNSNGFFGDNTEDFIEDASWVRLRELSLSYSLPRSIVAKSPFSRLSLSFTGRNLFLATPYKGVDPETNLYGASNAQGLDYFNMPGTRSYAFGINASF